MLVVALVVVVVLAVVAVVVGCWLLVVGCCGFVVVVVLGVVLTVFVLLCVYGLVLSTRFRLYCRVSWFVRVCVVRIVASVARCS